MRHGVSNPGPVDFVVVGAGAAGGVVARELARAGLSVVLLEQGPFHRAADFEHDELAVVRLEGLTNNHREHPNTFRESDAEEARVLPVVQYGRMVGARASWAAPPSRTIRPSSATSTSSRSASSTSTSSASPPARRTR